MPVQGRGTHAEVGITGLFWIRLTSGPFFHSKSDYSGPLCTSRGNVASTGHSSFPRTCLNKASFHSQDEGLKLKTPTLLQPLACSIVDFVTTQASCSLVCGRWRWSSLTRKTTFCLVICYFLFVCLFCFPHHLSISHLWFFCAKSTWAIRASMIMRENSLEGAKPIITE